MSRREPRVSTGTRQNDALFEYEALKKKFLHANKAITKLNSTLSIRVEELNAELSTLYVENLRLRTSEITLTAQLKREREKSRKLLVDTEAATLDLVKHLEHLRQSHNIDSSPPTPPTLPSPKARRPVQATNPDAQIGRLSRPPNIQEILEEDEPVASSSDSDSGQPNLFNPRTTSKPRSPAARASRKARPSPPLHIDLNTTTQRKKASRRQSGILSSNASNQLLVPRPSSPAFGSPIRKAAALAQADDEINDEAEVLNEYKTKLSVKVDHRKRQAKPADKELMEDSTSITNGADIRPSTGRKRPRVEDDATRNEDELKYVPRFALQPIDNTVQDQVDPEKKGTTSTSSITHSHVPTASSSNVPANVEPPGAGLAGRERRARKGVNYAEPKLNTKMRKPDPPPGTETTSRKKRSSAAAVMSTTVYKSRDVDMKGIEDDADMDNKVSSNHPPLVNYTPIQVITTSSMKKKSRLRLPSDDEDSSDGAEADEEYMPSGRANWVNLEGRKRIAISKRATTAFSPPIDAGTDTRRHSMAV